MDMTLEILNRQYLGGIRTISRTTVKGTPERKKAKRELWLQYLADLYRLNGDKQIFEDLQRMVFNRYTKTQRDFYTGKIIRATYKVRRVREVSLWYVRQLVKYGLATGEFDDEWIKYFADESLKRELKLVPPKTTGLTEQEEIDLCKLNLRLGRRFYKKVHEDFGIDTLKNNPEIYEFESRKNS